jgi:hypothetical protein
MYGSNVVRRVVGVVVLASAASLLAVAVACGSSGGGSAEPCAFDAGATFDAIPDTGCGDCTEAGLVCEAGSIPSMGRCMNVAGTLAGLRWELPCTMPGSNTCQTVVDGSDTQVVSTTLGGTSEQTYDVTLHLRGVVEMKTYIPGEAGAPLTAGAEGLANAQYFVSGGADNGDPFNVYELQVSDPPAVYFLNSGISEIQYTWWLDYTVTIPMNAGATVTMTANAVDDGQIANHNGVDGGPVLVPGVPPFPKAYDGQFIQMDVVSVLAQP